MLSEAIVHIGMHKTGSTSIQNALRNFDDGDCFYAQLSHVNHSIPIYTAFHQKYMQYHIWRKQGLSSNSILKLRKKYRSDIKEQLSTIGRKKIIISGEGICSLYPGDANEFINLMKEYAKNVRVIAYVRDPISFAASSFQQQVKGGLDRVPEIINPDYERRIGKFVDTLGQENVTVRPFSQRLLKNGSVVEDFCNIVDIRSTKIKDVRTNESMSLECLKLIYLFNRTNPCYFGDSVMFMARQKLISTLMEAYKGRRKVDKNIFRPIAELKSGDYLKDNFGLLFDEDEHSKNNKKTRSDLSEWMEDLSEVSTDPLQAVMEDFELSGKFQDTSTKLSRIFYHCIYKVQSERDLRSSMLRSADADILRKAALRFETGAPLSRDDAVGLMSLAARARPRGPKIQRKLKEWTGVDHAVEHMSSLDNAPRNRLGTANNAKIWARFAVKVRRVVSNLW